MYRISVCLICHNTPERARLLRNSLAAWQRQHTLAYEVIVAWDGDVAPGFHSTARVTHVSVPKTQPLADRNAARNAAAHAATGTHLWFVDGDFIPEPTVVAHAQIALEAEDCALSPVLVSTRATPQVWAQRPDTALYGVVGDQWSGFPHAYRPDKPGLTRAEDVVEGFPLLRRDVFWELGGFDATYVGWGANKEEFVDRLRTLADFYPYKLLASTRMYHQPHLSEGDPTNPLVLENQLRRKTALDCAAMQNLPARVKVLCGF